MSVVARRSTSAPLVRADCARAVLQGSVEPSLEQQSVLRLAKLTLPPGAVAVPLEDRWVRLPPDADDGVKSPTPLPVAAHLPADESKVELSPKPQRRSVPVFGGGGI